MARAKKSAVYRSVAEDFAFYTFLWDFYAQNRSALRSRYKQLTKVILDYNNPDRNPKAFLRKPQYEALEMYVFLKECLNLAPVHKIFEDWLHKRPPFEKRSDDAVGEEQKTLFGAINPEDYALALSRLKRHAQSYANYIFALTMGVGKTLLMATCVFYEFCLANRHPSDKSFCHNALIFAPDTTVLQSLKEIEIFDMEKVLPKDQANWLRPNLKMQFLTETASTLNVYQGSSFNLVVSNTQKIIAKRRANRPGPAARLFSPEKKGGGLSNLMKRYADIYDLDEAEISEGDLAFNQRFHTLCKLPNLGVFVDEAHHAFGAALGKDMGLGAQSDTSLRTTINLLARTLMDTGSHLVACYNFTGTPYVKDELLPEVVYSYGLKDAINARYLKTAEVKHCSGNVKSRAFIRETVRHFWEKYGGQTYEGMTPKLAIFAATIDELTKELRPSVEETLGELGLGIERILVNVGDEKITTNDDLRAFNSLDTTDSSKQFILLVGKGKEGWNCRSLFGVAMFREPKSKIFVLQATMRCLRSIGDTQAEAAIYLSAENRAILDAELQQNFRLRTDELAGESSGNSSQVFRVKVLKDVTIKLNRTEKLYKLEKREWTQSLNLALADISTDRWRATVRTTHGLLTEQQAKSRGILREEELSLVRYRFSRLTLCADIARYLNLSPIDIDDILVNSKDGLEAVLALVNEHNEALYEAIIPNLFNALFELKFYERKNVETIRLVKEPPHDKGCYEVHGQPELTRILSKCQHGPFPNINWASKSFHLDTYCFGSKPELSFFESQIGQTKIKELYLTGMLVHGQSDFHVAYIDPESYLLRHYYPDFLILLEDNTWMMIEIKGEDQIDNAVVQAKMDFACNLAEASKMVYKLVPSKEASKQIFGLNKGN